MARRAVERARRRGRGHPVEAAQGRVARATERVEVAFAPDPAGSGEDAGWLLTYVCDRVEARSDLVVVDAAALEEVARVHLPRRVPSGFHGNWFAAG